MTILLRRDKSWDLVNGDETMPTTPTITVQGKLEEGEVGVDAIIAKENPLHIDTN
jgi:hypothetical protein